MLLRGLVAASLLASNTPATPQTAPVTACPAPVPVPATVTAPNSTYYSNGAPPERFRHGPQITLKIQFGREAIDKLCGKPPCNMFFAACTRGDQMALPDPFTTDPAVFAHVLQHELGHVNGWPATHGD